MNPRERDQAMNPRDASPQPPPAVPAQASEQTVQAEIRQEVEHLFRHSLRQGHINPLMHVILAFRARELP